MKLWELAASAGLTLSQAADRCGVRPLLLSRIDAGMQPLTRSLEAKLAGVLGVSRIDVRTSVALTTELEGSGFLIPIPPQAGELVPATRLHPLVPVGFPGAPGVIPTALVALLAHPTNAITGASIAERFGTDGGALAFTDRIADNDPAFSNARGMGFGLYGEEATLWLGADDLSFNTMRVRASPLDLSIQDRTVTSAAFVGGAGAAIDPQRGIVWFCSGTEFLYRWNPIDAAPTQVTLSFLAPFTTSFKFKSLSFPGDGYLYGLIVNGMSSGVVKIDPTPGAESMVAVPASAYVNSAVPVADFVYGGSNYWTTDVVVGVGTRMVEWDRTALTRTIHTCTTRFLFNGAFDPTTDRLLYNSAPLTLATSGAARVTRAGAVDWVDDSAVPAANIGVCRSALTFGKRWFACSGVVGGLNKVLLYDADSGALLSSALAGVGGPGADGANLPIVGMLFT